MDLVKAIGRGFAPHRAMRLLDEDEYLEIVEIGDFVGKKSDKLSRMRSRLIGTNGKTRRIIEDLTGANVSIYGSTVALIGNSVQLPVAKKAVEMILRGSEHATVYRYLERSRLRCASPRWASPEEGREAGARSLYPSIFGGQGEDGGRPHRHQVTL